VYLVNFKGKDLVFKAMREEHLVRSNFALSHIREAMLLYLLKDNPYIVSHLAHCMNLQTSEFVLITKFFKKGSVEDLMERGGLRSFRVGEMLNWNIQMARGLQAIHEVKGGPFVHADLQLRQFLIDDDDTVKLNDFNRGTWSYRDNQSVVCSYCGPGSHGP